MHRRFPSPDRSSPLFFNDASIDAHSRLACHSALVAHEFGSSGLSRGSGFDATAPPRSTSGFNAASARSGSGFDATAPPRSTSAGFDAGPARSGSGFDAPAAPPRSTSGFCAAPTRSGSGLDATPPRSGSARGSHYGFDRRGSPVFNDQHIDRARYASDFDDWRSSRLYISRVNPPRLSSNPFSASSPIFDDGLHDTCRGSPAFDDKDVDRAGRYASDFDISDNAAFFLDDHVINEHVDRGRYASDNPPRLSRYGPLATSPAFDDEPLYVPRDTRKNVSRFLPRSTILTAKDRHAFCASMLADGSPYSHLLDDNIFNSGFFYEEGDDGFKVKDSNNQMTNLGKLSHQRWKSGILALHFLFPSHHQASNARTTEGPHGQATFFDLVKAMQKYIGPDIRFVFYSPHKNHSTDFLFVLNGEAAEEYTSKIDWKKIKQQITLDCNPSLASTSRTIR
jgi:hypothetical protein